MAKLKRLSGLEVIKILEKFAFQMRRFTETGKETLTIPNYKQLDTGTCKAILKQASQYIRLSELYKYFYH